jgi:hypothetical protein
LIFGLFTVYLGLGWVIFLGSFNASRRNTVKYGEYVKDMVQKGDFGTVWVGAKMQ